MTTHTNTPELQAQYEALSPNAQAFVDHWLAWTGSMSADNRKLADFGLDALLTAAEQERDGQHEIALADEADRVLDDDDPITVLDDGQDSGVRVERHDQHTELIA